MVCTFHALAFVLAPAFFLFGQCTRVIPRTNPPVRVIASTRAARFSTGVQAPVVDHHHHHHLGHNTLRSAVDQPHGICKPSGSSPNVSITRWSRRVLCSVFAGLGVSVETQPRAVATPGLAIVHTIDGEEVQVPGSYKGSSIARYLANVKYPKTWPYKDRDFDRLDGSDDSLFYQEPKFVKHLDDKSLTALTAYYGAIFPKTKKFSALDLCSSWVSHYPKSPRPVRLAVTGMNAEELKQNAQATDWKVQDLNSSPTLPYGDAEFDFVTNTVSVDYLTRPLDVFREIRRVLRPGGVATVAYSRRCFITKVIPIWSSGDMEDRAELVANYFHFAGGFLSPEVVDVSPPDADPVYIVSAVKG